MPSGKVLLQGGEGRGCLGGPGEPILAQQLCEGGGAIAPKSLMNF